MLIDFQAALFRNFRHFLHFSYKIHIYFAQHRDSARLPYLYKQFELPWAWTKSSGCK